MIKLIRSLYRPSKASAKLNNALNKKSTKQKKTEAQGAAQDMWVAMIFKATSVAIQALSDTDSCTH
jgi:hypothetical protein